jgi:hypothetical protein
MEPQRKILWATDPAAWVALSKQSESRLAESQDFETLKKVYFKTLSNPMGLDYFEANFKTAKGCNEPSI